jgi:hypothetical protein
MVVVEYPRFAYDSGSASQKNVQYRERPAWGEVGRSEHGPEACPGFSRWEGDFRKIMLASVPIPTFANPCGTF